MFCTGMPPEVMDRAFEPFFTTKPKGEGTGLGLATIYGIITQANGDVRIYSQLGLGTTITILLPATSEAPLAADRPANEPEGGHGELVLVVEDEPALREVTRRILVRNGYRVIVAVDGPGAIRTATDSGPHIDVLLTDVVMPGMQGRHVAEQVCELKPGIKVLYMSGYTQRLLDSQGILEPGVNLIEKPFTEASLLRNLARLLRGRAAQT